MADRQQQSVIGFTEAELGFFLAMMLLVLFVVTQATNPPLQPPSTNQLPETTLTLASVRGMEAALQRLRADSTQKAALESRIWPACDSRERGVTAGPLARIVLQDDARFLLGTARLTDRQLASRFAGDLETAASRRCRHRLVLDFADGLRAELLVDARRRLEQLGFRPSDGRAVP